MHTDAPLEVMTTRRGISLSYPQAKVEALEIIDDFASSIDLMAGYGSPGRFDARTRLSEIGIDETVRVLMHKRLNKAFSRLRTWRNIAPEDLERCHVIGDVVMLVCERGAVGIPAGEPR